MVVQKRDDDTRLSVHRAERLGELLARVGLCLGRRLPCCRLYVPLASHPTWSAHAHLSGAALAWQGRVASFHPFPRTQACSCSCGRLSRACWLSRRWPGSRSGSEDGLSPGSGPLRKSNEPSPKLDPAQGTAISILSLQARPLSAPQAHGHYLRIRRTTFHILAIAVPLVVASALVTIFALAECSLQADVVDLRAFLNGLVRALQSDPTTDVCSGSQSGLLQRAAGFQARSERTVFLVRAGLAVWTVAAVTLLLIWVPAFRRQRWVLSESTPALALTVLTVSDILRRQIRRAARIHRRTYRKPPPPYADRFTRFPQRSTQEEASTAGSQVRAQETALLRLRGVCESCASASGPTLDVPAPRRSYGGIRRMGLRGDRRRFPRSGDLGDGRPACAFAGTGEPGLCPDCIVRGSRSPRQRVADTIAGLRSPLVGWSSTRGRCGGPCPRLARQPGPSSRNQGTSNGSSRRRPGPGRGSATTRR